MLTGRARTFATTTLAILITFGASGCLAPTETPEPSASATPSASPLFASDEEALAAATKAYAAYLAVADAVGSSGGADVERLAPLVSTSYMEAQRSSYTKLRESRARTDGSSSFRTYDLQSFDRDAQEVSIYVCLNISKVRVIDSEGVDITPPDRLVTFPFIIVMAHKDGEPRLVVDSSEGWTGESYCSD